MARKKPAQEPESKKVTNENVMGLRAEVLEQPRTETLETHYMPYAMSVIVSRAIPEIDGFKPSHRKLLYTMYKMGLLTGSRTKSANIVGQTMKLNTVKKITVIGLLLSVLLCLIGMFGMEPSSPQASSMAVWAVVVLLFTMAVVLKWSRCHWCGGLIIKKLFSIKECPHCGRDLETGKKKKGKGGKK